MSGGTQPHVNPETMRPGRVTDRPYIAPGTPRPGTVSEAQGRRQNYEREDRPRRDTRPQRPVQDDRRPRFEVQAHQGRCSPEEVNTLRACMMHGTKPFANLIAAGYAKRNDDNEDWYITESGRERIREFTMANASRNVS